MFLVLSICQQESPMWSLMRWTSPYRDHTPWPAPPLQGPLACQTCSNLFILSMYGCKWAVGILLEDYNDCLLISCHKEVWNLSSKTCRLGQSLSDIVLTVFFQLGRKPSVTDFHSVVRLIGIGQSVTSSALSSGSWTMLVYSGETSGVEIDIAFDITGILISDLMIGQILWVDIQSHAEYRM